MNPKEKFALQLILTDAYSSFEKGLKTHASFRLNDGVKCDDLVQDTFLKTWAYLVREGRIDLMKPFLYHILNCLIIDEYRKHKSSSLDKLIEKGFEPSSDDTGRLADIFDGTAALSLIEHLPLPYRNVLKMRFIENLSLEEMALRTGKSRNIMAVQSHRGIERLRILYIKM